MRMLLGRRLFAVSTLVLALAACGDQGSNSSTTSSSVSTQSSSSGTPSSSQTNSSSVHAPSQGLQTKFVTIATGGASGPYNIIATTLSERYNQAYGVNAKTQTTGASVENINLINQKKVEMAFVMSDVLSDAVAGTNSFPNKIDTVSQIASLYPNFVQVVTSKRSGIKTLQDLKGKRVAVGAQNSGVEVNARSLIYGVGLTYQDMKVDYLGYAEAADALKAGRIDAAFLTSGLPNASLMELQQSFDLQLVTIPQDQVRQIAQDKAYFVSLDIPAGTYGNEAPVQTAAIMNALVVRRDLSEDDVYHLTKTFYESLPQLRTAHQAANGIEVNKGRQGMVAPIHPGAKRYYDEVAAK